MARKAETTPCPRCGKELAVRGDTGTCPACGLGVRFVDAPERPCTACGKPVVLTPGKEAVRCRACGAWQAVEEGRPVEGEAVCPRCGRAVTVPLQGDSAACPRCGAAMALGNVL